ncbi:protein-glutamate methylesterase/protein-glutamine glutaminase [Natranaerofaba carboxydovora]|uniref:protein-glutamate methylesterase/protein-glutamine glutaminase n=1 Tax=Natranaerofaba carboxydovora TaxID=2742683 RepID=UPI001F12BAA9|nr:chemotaxis response regulator protein-glutamate methylesterase [Natranaerofaba carboxydovora]UMZ73383.1 Chemotaxis response regulator protein-glutamate methylesterase [Natranaerofaba carboxydovora]
MIENKTINVLVVDDSAFMRKVVSDIVESGKGLKVISTARNGKQAIEKIKELNPDVVTLDIEMPELDGLETLKKLKSLGIKIPVIMLSSFTTEGSKATLKALELGAVDFVAKPSGPISLDIHTVKTELIEKIQIASKAKVHTERDEQKDKKDFESTTETTVKPARKPKPKVEPDLKVVKQTGEEFIIAIGASTGGPRALNEVIPKLPQNIPACVLITQHMPAGFTKLMGERLSSVSQLNVKEAEDGDRLEPGKAFIAPGGFHLKLKKDSSGTKGLRSLKIVLDKSPPVKGLRPSVDIMFESISNLAEIKKLAVILTGMGSDGAEGVKMIKDSGGQVIVEDESSCVVFGMPRAAQKTGVVDKTLHLSSIASEIIRRIK